MKVGQVATEAWLLYLAAQLSTERWWLSGTKRSETRMGRTEIPIGGISSGY